MAKTGAHSKDITSELCDQPSSLWLNGEQTTSGCNNCVSAKRATRLKNSLYLIFVERLAIEVTRVTRKGQATYKYKGKFRYGNANYFMKLTDPVVIDYLCHKGQGNYPFENVYLTVSLTEPFKWDDRCHKLIAAVMRKPA